MRKTAIALTSIIILLLTGCSSQGDVLSSSSTESSAVSFVTSVPDSDPDSTASVDSVSWEEKKTRMEEGIKATAYYYFYHDLNGEYIPSEADENAYWMTLNYYHAIRKTDVSEHSDQEETSDLRNMSQTEASDVLYSLFPDFDGTLHTDIPEDINGITFENGRYYFEGGDFGDDLMRIIDGSESFSASDSSYDITVEQYYPYYENHTYYEKVNHIYYVHIRPDQQKTYGAVIESIREIETDTESADLHVQIGDRETTNYYYKNDPEQELLVKKEKMLPVLTGGDESITEIQDQINHLSSEIDSDAGETFEEYSRDMAASDSLSKATGLESLLSRITFDDGRYLTLEVLEQHYEGGAHGSQIYYYYVLDKEEGKRLRLSDIINNDEEDFEALFEKHFDENIHGETFSSVSEIAEQKSLDSYTFFLTDNALYIHFNRGEIGPTALGDPCVIIPYSELDMKISVGSGDQPCDDPESFYYDL